MSNRYQARMRVQETVDLGDGYVATIRRLTREEIRRVEAAMTDGRQSIRAGDESVVKMDTSAYRDAMVEQSVTSWNIDADDCGAGRCGGHPEGIWPVDAAHISQLPGPDFDAIWKAANALNSARRSSEEQTAFRAGGELGDRARDGDGSSGDRALLSGAPVLE